MLGSDYVADGDYAAGGTPCGMSSFADRCRDSTPKSCRSARSVASPKSCRSSGSARGNSSVSSRGRRLAEEDALRQELARLRDEMERLQKQVAAVKAPAYEA